MKSKQKILDQYPILLDDLNDFEEDVRFSVKHLVPMKDCECGGGHEPIPGVMYRMCQDCRGLYAVKDLEYIKKHGELPDMYYDSKNYEL
jgi:hypothetical protein